MEVVHPVAGSGRGRRPELSAAELRAEIERLHRLVALADVMADHLDGLLADARLAGRLPCAKCPMALELYRAARQHL